MRKPDNVILLKLYRYSWRVVYNESSKEAHDEKVSLDLIRYGA